MAYVFGIFVLLLIIYGIVKAVSGNPYSEMSEEEFEAEAKRGSLIGPAIMSLQKNVDPNHHVEYVQEQKESIEAVSAESGDHPDRLSSSEDPNYKLPG